MKVFYTDFYTFSITSRQSSINLVVTDYDVFAVHIAFYRLLCYDKYAT